MRQRCSRSTSNIVFRAPWPLAALHVLAGGRRRHSRTTDGVSTVETVVTYRLVRGRPPPHTAPLRRYLQVPPHGSFHKPLPPRGCPKRVHQTRLPSVSFVSTAVRAARAEASGRSAAQESGRHQARREEEVLVRRRQNAAFAASRLGVSLRSCSSHPGPRRSWSFTSSRIQCVVMSASTSGWNWVPHARPPARNTWRPSPQVATRCDVGDSLHEYGCHSKAMNGEPIPCSKGSSSVFSMDVPARSPARAARRPRRPQRAHEQLGAETDPPDRGRAGA